MRSIDDYEGLIRNLEARAKNHPEACKSRVIQLTLLGYGYLYFMLILGLAAAGLLVYAFAYSHTLHAVFAKLIYLVVVLLVLIVRSLWFKIEPPDGLDVTEADFPRLFGIIREVNGKLKGPKIHHVRIDDDFNAAIVQLPRFGLFGFHRNYLLIGLPMLLSLSETELKSVIAHEIGHLAGEDGRMGRSFTVRANPWRASWPAWRKSSEDGLPSCSPSFFGDTFRIFWRTPSLSGIPQSLVYKKKK